ncbi:thioesterase superfamily protein [Colletotrichum tofieldiae]|nr:thioesterase superfamily protein [Colletotrichum tofieldiae]
MPPKLPPLRFVRSVLNSFAKDSGLEPRLLGNNFRVTGASVGKVDFELAIQKEHTRSLAYSVKNRLSTIHGGTLASLVDLGGSLAVASKGRFMTGVSTDINVGRTLAYTTVTFFNKKGELAARGSHTKYIAKTWETEDFVAPDEYVAEEEK